MDKNYGSRHVFLYEKLRLRCADDTDILISTETLSLTIVRLPSNVLYQRFNF
jgi:hypothetical protein